jgi:hypothetical protein
MPQEAPPHSNSHSDAAAASAPASTDVSGPGSDAGKRLAIGLGFDRLAKLLVYWGYHSGLAPNRIERWTGEPIETLRQWSALYEEAGLWGLAGIDTDNPMAGGIPPLRLEECRLLAHFEATVSPKAHLSKHGGDAGRN